MSLNKANEHGKEHRKSYSGAKKYDKHCCNHGTCLWCQSDRRYKEFKEIERYKFDMKEYERNDNL